MVEYGSQRWSRDLKRTVFQRSTARTKEKGGRYQKYLEIHQQALAIVATS